MPSNRKSSMGKHHGSCVAIIISTNFNLRDTSILQPIEGNY